VKKNYFLVNIVAFVLFFQIGFSQTNTNVGQANGLWIPLMKGDRFDPNDDQQSVADTYFVGNATYALVHARKRIINFCAGMTGDS